MEKSKEEPLRNVIGSKGKTNGEMRDRVRGWWGRITGRKAK